MTTYKQAQKELKSYAKAIKPALKGDNPAIRMYINDFCDHLCKNYQFSEYYRNLLSNYSIKFHPKN